MASNLYSLLYPLFQSGRKETVLDLAKFVDKGVQVKLTGGRQGMRILILIFVGGLLFSNLSIRLQDFFGEDFLLIYFIGGAD